jgi:predicted DNA-binding transcriptional regulator AlpA
MRRTTVVNTIPPINLATVADPLIDIEAVAGLVGLKRSAIYRRLAAARFPAPVRLSTRATRWRLSAIKSWIDQQTARVPA